MAEFDPHEIERRLMEYDDRVLRIDFDHRRGLHRIICFDTFLQEEYIAMTVPAGQLDARVEIEMMKINPNHFNALEYIDKARADKERRDDNKVGDMARDFAELFHKPLVKHATGA